MIFDSLTLPPGAERPEIGRSETDRIAFDLLEQRAPHIAELMLRLAALPLPLPELIAHFRALTRPRGLNESDFKAAVAALRHARRQLNAVIREH